MRWVVYQAEVFTEATIGNQDANIPFALAVDGPDAEIVDVTLDADGDEHRDGILQDNADADFFRVVSPRFVGRRLTVRLTPEADLDAVLTLYDDAGMVIDRQDHTLAGGVEEVSFDGVVGSHTYFVRVGSKQYASHGQFTLDVDFQTPLPPTLTLAEGFAYFHNDGTSHDTQTFSDAVGEAWINFPGDVDSFYMAGALDGIYTITGTGVDAALAPVVAVYNSATGLPLDPLSENVGFHDHQMTVQLQAQYRYIVAIADRFMNETGDVLLEIEGPSVLGSTPITIGDDGIGFLSGQSLDVDEDTDFFRFTAPADADGTLSVTVWPVVNLDVAAVVMDASGNELVKAYLQPSGEPEAAVYQGAVPGNTYYLTVLSNDYASAGNFQVEVAFALCARDAAGKCLL